MKFRKKPVEIEAVQYTGSNYDEVCAFVGQELDHIIENDKFKLVIHTLKGNMRADHKDWITKGVKGEFYPCKPDIFQATYEKV